MVGWWVGWWWRWSWCWRPTLPGEQRNTRVSTDQQRRSLVWGKRRPQKQCLATARCKLQTNSEAPSVALLQSCGGKNYCQRKSPVFSRTAVTLRENRGVTTRRRRPSRDCLATLAPGKSAGRPRQLEPWARTAYRGAAGCLSARTMCSLRSAESSEPCDLGVGIGSKRCYSKLCFSFVDLAVATVTTQVSHGPPSFTMAPHPHTPPLSTLPGPSQLPVRAGEEHAITKVNTTKSH